MKFILLIALIMLGACATQEPVRFTSTSIVWQDDDLQPIEEPEEYWSGLYWDGADKMFFGPLADFWLLEQAQPAQNVNALDEVPNSSWYTNRLALMDLSPEEVANGPCTKEIDVTAKWLVKSGKVDGANPGFVIQDTSDGRGYLLKFDDVVQIERATGADVIGSKVYWAAGFSTPCNRVIFFDPANLEIAEGASKKDNLGNKTSITAEDVEFAIRSAPRLPGGKIRGSASLFLEGKPMGPFRYNDTRPDDPNDVTPHEHRRELRGSLMLAAWLNHFDAREQNTFTTFVEGKQKGWGYIQHHILDWGDCFGSRWENDLMSRRFGHSSYFDIPDILADLLSFGLIVRPWDLAQEAPNEGPIFGYYDVANFDPDTWANGYPHKAFSAADEVDMFWGAKIISRFTDAHITRLVQEAHFSSARNTRYLERVLIGRRDKIVRKNFERISPFDLPRTRAMEFCVDDLGVRGGYYDSRDSFYEVSVEGGDWWPVDPTKPGEVCVDLFNSPVPGDYTVVKLRARRVHQFNFARPTELHFMIQKAELRIVGIDRYPLSK